MKMMDHKASAVARQVKAHPALQFAGGSNRTSIFGDSSPTSMGAGINKKLGASGPSMMNASFGKSKAMNAMKFMTNKIGA